MFISSFDSLQENLQALLTVLLALQNSFATIGDVFPENRKIVLKLQKKIQLPRTK